MPPRRRPRSNVRAVPYVKQEPRETLQSRSVGEADASPPRETEAGASPPSVPRETLQSRSVGEAGASPPRETGPQGSVPRETLQSRSVGEADASLVGKQKQEARHVRRNFRFFYGGLMGIPYYESDSE